MSADSKPLKDATAPANSALKPPGRLPIVHPCLVCGQPAERFAIMPNAEGVFELAGHICNDCLRARWERK